MARQVLENGVILPAEYSDDWYDDMTSNLTKLDDVIGSDSEKLSSADVGAAALSNNYNDLDNLPTIPTVNDATLTIQKNGVDVQTFTANASSNVTCNITVPTKTSDLTNDSDFVDTSNSAVSSGITSAKVTDYDTHIADTDIHVTTADKTTWNAVTSKANDSGVVHKSGDETVGGKKTFSDNTYITSLNFTSEVASSSSSSSAIMPIVTTVTYTDSSPSQSARLNLRITADGVKSFFPHDNNVSLGLATRVWSDFFAYHGYFRGQQQGDEYSGNVRTNLTLLANRDVSGQSGCVVDTFRENTTQGTGSHILGFGIKENSVRYEGCRLSWFYDNNSGYIFSLRPTTQGTNQPIKYELGTSSAKWSTINGLNPSSLGMPDLSNGIDISSYITLNSDSSYIPLSDGYVSICCYSSAACGLWVRDSNNNGVSTRSIGSVPTYNNLVSICIPVVKNVSLSIFTPGCENILTAKFFPCQGNV